MQEIVISKLENGNQIALRIVRTEEDKFGAIRYLVQKISAEGMHGIFGLYEHDIVSRSFIGD